MYDKRFKDVTLEEALEFLHNKEMPFADGKDASFVYKQNYEGVEISGGERQKVAYDVTLYGVLDKKLVGEVHYEFDYKKNVVKYLQDEKEKSITTSKEIGNLFYREDSLDNEYYITLYNKISKPFSNLKQNVLKTTLIKNSLYVPYVKDECEFVVGAFNGQVPYTEYLYMSGNKFKVIKVNDSSHQEIIYTFKNNVLSEYYEKTEYKSKTSISYVEKEIKYKNAKNVKVPLDAKRYETKEQEFVPRFYDYTYGKIILGFICFNLVNGVVAVILIKLLKRPKYVE